jgi:type I restriction enzyme S subunit
VTDIRPTWTIATLDKLLDLVIDYRGKTPKKLGGSWLDSGIPAVSAKNVKNGRFVRDDCIKYVSSELYAKWMKDELEAGDILLTSEAPLGQTLFLKQKMQLVLSQRLFALRVNQRIINPRFLCYFLESEMGQFELHSRATGATAQGIRQSLLMDVAVSFPPLPMQRKIAEILSAYDDLIENNLRRIKILEEIAQNLYREWFVKFRFPGHEHACFSDSPLGRVPEGWKVDTVENTFSILGGGTPSKNVPEYWENGTINWYVPTDLTATSSMFMDHSGNQISELGLKKSSARLFPAFSVMMTSRATLGVISISTTEACTNQGFITCVPNKRFPLYTLFYWLKENAEYFISLGTGATFKEITKGVFKTIELVVPAETVASKFEDTLQQFALQILNLQRKNTTLRRTRDLLLPKLISGEVGVAHMVTNLPLEQ